MRTRQAGLYLLAKNHALAAAGIPALPGAGHEATLAGWGPALAGAVFFALSLGLGWGTLFGLWGLCWSSARGLLRRLGPWIALAVPGWAGVRGDGALAGALAACALGAVGIAAAGSRRPSSLLRRGLLVGLVGLGLVPWARAPEGPFTRLRDRYLLTHPPGIALDTLYYRWTLYPAEALKPLAAKSQPTAAPAPALPPTRYERFCDEASRLGVVCLPRPGAGADLTVALRGETIRLAAAGGATGWPDGDLPGQREAWAELSRQTDPARPLRRATAAALFLGVPLALCWALATWADRLSRALPGPKARRAGAAACAALVAGLLALTAVPNPDLTATRRRWAEAEQERLALAGKLLLSPNAALRFHAARLARQLGPAAAPLLLDGLTDPVINVRYAAAESLGAVGAPQVRDVLLRVLESPEEWYVKERAYGALRRLGWRPR
ncbi:MAG: hypothetical protein Kow0092_19460 [Deferrisomatales bacterium]